MVEVERYVSDYWGKAYPKPDARAQWHPIAYHGLDVAAAGEALLGVWPDLTAHLARRTGLKPELVKNWLLFGLAIHDVGKFADCFQVKRAAGRIVEPANKFTPSRDPGHGSTGLALWNKSCDLDLPSDEGCFLHLLRNAPALGRHSEGLHSWVAAIFGHHGRPVDETSLNLNDLISMDSARDASAFVEAVTKIFPITPSTSSAPALSVNFKETSWLIAGISIIADWIGSNQDWFDYEPANVPLEQYWLIAQARAALAIDQAGLARPTPAEHFSLRDALGLCADQAEPSPSDLQAWAAGEFRPNSQTLVVIEDLTGAGKTEAALIAAHRLIASGSASGLYWALPTMATSNGLYTRLAKSYERLFSDPKSASLVLAHGKRNFNEAFQRSVMPAGAREKSYGTTNDDESGSAQCAAWIADDRRKALLADVGVGTIDQALLGVLPAKHQALRLAALSQRVLVIDEVHSFDPYVSRLIVSLLRFHAANGGSAILLTATLTQKLRAELVSAFAKGAHWPTPEISENAFPLVTVVTKCESVLEHPRRSTRGSRRDLAIARIDTDRTAADLLIAAYERGEASVWIRNTVHDAIFAASVLREHLGEDAVELFHARFTVGDRIDIENRTLDRFGRRPTQRRRCVLVATQVVEQSLDLDFDIMISDLAPIDLLIQRAGRLHRHDRGVRSDPILHIYGPAPISDAAATWFASMFPKGQYVYANHGQLWLTMKHLIEAGGLKLASVSPRIPIETVFVESPVLPPGLVDVAGRAIGAQQGNRGMAALHALDLREGYAAASGTWASDLDTPTRLGPPQRRIQLAKWDGSSLVPWYENDDPQRAWRLSELQVSAARVASVEIGDLGLQRVHDALIADWSEKFAPPLLAPLTLVDGVWCCDVFGAPDRNGVLGQRSTLSYCKSFGLRL